MINLAMILLIILGFMLFYIFILLCEASLIMASFNFSVGDLWRCFFTVRSEDTTRV